MSVKRRKRIQKIGLEKMPEGIGHVLTEWLATETDETEYGFVNGIVPFRYWRLTKTRTVVKRGSSRNYRQGQTPLKVG